MTTTHQQYKAASPYYRSILDKWGRWLTYSQVIAVLTDHSILLADYMADGHPLPPASAETDAAELVQWLGY